MTQRPTYEELSAPPECPLCARLLNAGRHTFNARHRGKRYPIESPAWICSGCGYATVPPHHLREYFTKLKEAARI